MVEKHHSTIIIVPHAQGRVYKLHISPRALKALIVAAVGFGLLSLFSLAASGSFLRQRAIYKALQRENKQLKRSNQKLSETIAQVEARLEQFDRRTQTLAIAAGVSDMLNPSLDDGLERVGSGGPVADLSSEGEALVRRQEVMERQLSRIERKVSEQTIMLAHTPTVAPVVGVITDGFGPRLDPLDRRPSFHDGLDISVAHGTSVHAPADGLVVFADRENGYGKMMRVSHGYGYSTIYGHLDRFLVKEGEKVTRGQAIGKVGMTGRTTGPHLHYEVWKDGEKQNPLHYILDAY